MKLGILLAILLLLMPIGYAKTKTIILDRGDSYVMEDNNITLIDYNKKRDKVLVCVDDERAIISEEKRVGWVYFEVKSFRDDGVKMTLDADCDDCVVSDNSECFLAKNTITLNESEEESPEENLVEIIEDNETFADDKIQKKEYKGVFKRILFAVIGLF